MRLDIGRVLTHDNYTLEFDCGEDFSARETMDGSRPFAEVRVRGTVRMRYDGIRLQANIEAPCVAPCSRCLEPVRFMLEEPFIAYVAEKGEVPDDDGDKLVLPLKNGRYVERAAVRLSEQSALRGGLQRPVPPLRLQPQYRIVLLCVRRVSINPFRFLYTIISHEEVS